MDHTEDTSPPTSEIDDELPLPSLSFHNIEDLSTSSSHSSIPPPPDDVIRSRASSASSSSSHTPPPPPPPPEEDDEYYHYDFFDNDDFEKENKENSPRRMGNFVLSSVVKNDGDTPILVPHPMQSPNKDRLSIKQIEVNTTPTINCEPMQMMQDTHVKQHPKKRINQVPSKSSSPTTFSHLKTTLELERQIWTLRDENTALELKYQTAERVCGDLCQELEFIHDDCERKWKINESEWEKRIQEEKQNHRDEMTKMEEHMKCWNESTKTKFVDGDEMEVSDNTTSPKTCKYEEMKDDESEKHKKSVDGRETEDSLSQSTEMNNTTPKTTECWTKLENRTETKGNNGIQNNITPEDETLKSCLRDATAKIHQMEDEIKSTKREAESRIRSLKQNHQRLRNNYEIKIAQLNAKIKSATPVIEDIRKNGLQSPTKTISPQSSLKKMDMNMKTPMDHIRAHYQTKIKDMQKKHEVELRGMKKKLYEKSQMNGNKCMGTVKITTPAHETAEDNATLSSPNRPISRRTKERIRKLEDLVTEQKSIIQELETKGSWNDGVFSSAKTSNELQGDNTEEEMNDLRMQLLSLLDPKLNEESDDDYGKKSYSDIIAQLRCNKEASKEIISDLRKQLSEANSSLINLQAQTIISQQQQSPYGQTTNSNNPTTTTPDQTFQLTQELQSAQVHIHQLQNQIQSLQNENSTLQMQQLEQYPTWTKYANLNQKISQLESRAALREEELKSVIETTKASNREEIRNMQRLHEEEMREKEEQIRVFRCKLKDLMEGVKELAALKRDKSRNQRDDWK